MTDRGRFEGVTALVTGAGQGIGRACAVRLAAEGARVIVSDVDLDLARSVADALPRSTGSVALAMDVTDRVSVDSAVTRVADEHGGLDAVVNVAGGDLPHGIFEETGDDVWSAVLELNLIGVARVCRATIPFLRRSSRSPSIVTISSINGQTALGSEPYSAAKAGLTALTANLARNLAPDGVRVNAVAPGTIRTRVWDDQDGGADRMLPLYPLGRVGSRPMSPRRLRFSRRPMPTGSPVMCCPSTVGCCWPAPPCRRSASAEGDRHDQPDGRDDESRDLRDGPHPRRGGRLGTAQALAGTSARSRTRSRTYSW